VIDDVALDEHLHLDQPGRFPLTLSGSGIPPGLTKATQPVKIVAKSDIGKKPVLRFTLIEVTTKKANVRYRYDIEGIRGAFGRHYDNQALEDSIEAALATGCKRVDVFFMIGLPKQTPASVSETMRYCEQLLTRARELGCDKRLHPYVSPLSPFLDPGSRAFENPDKYGYRLFCRSLEEHRQALLAPSWKRTLNYETQWMTRDELVESTYDAALELNRLKQEYGLLDPDEAARISRRIGLERELVAQIDVLEAIEDEQERQQQLRVVMEQFDALGASTICQKDEMNWPSALLRFNPLRVVWQALIGKQRG